MKTIIVIALLLVCNLQSAFATRNSISRADSVTVDSGKVLLVKAGAVLKIQGTLTDSAAWDSLDAIVTGLRGDIGDSVSRAVHDSLSAVDADLVGVVLRDSLGAVLPDTTYTRMTIADDSVSTTAHYTALEVSGTKRAGATNYLDYVTGLAVTMRSADTADSLGLVRGAVATAGLDSGIVAGARGATILADVNGGMVTDDVFGLTVAVDIEAAVDTVKGDVYGLFIDVDDDKTGGDKTHMLYLNEGNNVDFGIYQDGGAANLLRGNLQINKNGVADLLSNHDLMLISGADTSYVDAGGASFTVPSNARNKLLDRKVDIGLAAAVAQGLRDMPLWQWRWKTQPDMDPRVGPTAQGFYQVDRLLFPASASQTEINGGHVQTAHAVAIWYLLQQNAALQSRLDVVQAEQRDLLARVQALEAVVSPLE
jgi:hypothetical protein